MKTHDFWYDLPEELIAQTPLEKRDTSRLLVMDRDTGAVSHKHFYDILIKVSVDSRLYLYVNPAEESS